MKYTIPEELTNPDDRELAADLLGLADTMTPSAAFRRELENDLRQAHPANRQRGQVVRFRPRLSMVAAVIVALMVGAFLVSPLPSMAQDLIDNLFNRVPATQTFDDPQTFSLAATPMRQGAFVAGSLSSAQSAAPFAIKVPAYVPEGYDLLDAEYDALARQTYQFYGLQANGIYDHFSIVQIPVENNFQLDIAETAVVTPVTINGYAGEFVTGSWKAITTADDTTMTVEGREWDPDFPYSQLLWSDGEFIYWMQSPIGQATQLPLDEWIRIAESLQ